MEKSTAVRSGRHCVFTLHAHFVFVTKYRRPVLSKSILTAIYNIFYQICQESEVQLVEFEGECDHVHLLINYPPKVCLSKLTNLLNGRSSRQLRQQFPEIQHYYWKGVFWSPSYFVGSCGGAPLAVIKNYIQNQSVPFK